jgi:pimeloyl-ACP methyl ester carboxylesterase
MPVLLLLALVLQQTPASASPQQPRSPEPVIEWVELPADLPQQFRDSVRFGYLAVPQDHADPDGPRIRIAIALLPARGGNPLPDPVVSIAGGPGLPAIAGHMRLRQQGPHPLDAYRDRRDLIIIDVRGHGFSEPAMCGELLGGEPVSRRGRDTDITGEEAEAERVWLAKLEACRTRLESQGARLETLSAVQAAHDLELLRRALGATQLNLVGISYGTRIAAEAVRQVPGSIRAVYYYGPVPAGRHGDVAWAEIAAEVVGALLRRCASQPACDAAYPRLAADHDSVLVRLRRAPVSIPVPRSDAAPEGRVLVDDELMQEGFAQILLNRQLAAGAPLLIHTLAVEGMAPLGSMAAGLMSAIGNQDVDPGTFLSFWCNDGVVSRTSSDLLQQRCRVWLGESWRGDAAEPVRSDVPALIETGEFDPRTPPSHAHFLAGGMSRAHVVIMPWYGHERPPDCSFRISRAFFDAPHDVPDLSCTDSIPAVEYVTGVAASRRVSTAVGRLARQPWLAVLPAAAVVLLAVPVVGLPVRYVRARRRGRRDRAGIGAVALLLLAVVALTFVIGLAVALVVGARRHFFIPAIGLPREWAWLLALPWLLLVITPVAAVLAHSRRFGDAGEVPAILRWAALLGATLLLALWVVS